MLQIAIIRLRVVIILCLFASVVVVLGLFTQPTLAAVKSSGCAAIDGSSGIGDFVYSFTGEFTAGEVITVTVEQVGEMPRAVGPGTSVEISFGGSLVGAILAFPGSFTFTVPNTGKSELFFISDPAEQPMDWSLECGAAGSTPASKPAACSNDRRINTLWCEPVAIYPYVDEDGLGLEVYIVYPSPVGRFGFRVTAAELAALPDKPDENILIASSADGFAKLYKLTTGEYQINAGPDAEGKVYVFRFSQIARGAVTYSTFVLP